MWHALIRTHHITSRKKVATLKAAAKKLECYALLRSGGVPGVMYVQGDGQDNVQTWVDAVHGLRYKDYQLASAVSEASTKSKLGTKGVLEEVATVREMAAKMEDAELLDWWRKGMGFCRSMNGHLEPRVG